MPPTKNRQPPSKRSRRDAAPGRFLPTISTSGPSPQAQEQAILASPRVIITPGTDSSHGMAPPTSASKRKCEEEDEEADQEESAVERVFRINELVEEILSYLSPAELLRAQGVKQTFQAVYKGSKQLQLKTFERIHGTSKQFQPVEVNPLLTQWVHENEDRKEVEYRVTIAPPSIPQVSFSEVHNDWHTLRVWFQVDGGEYDEIDHTKSCTREHIYDADSTITVEVYCGMKQLEHITEDIILLDLYASVKVCNCALGKLLRIAKKLKQLSDFSYLDEEDNKDGDASFDLSQNRNWLANMRSELMQLIEGDLALTSVLA